MNAGYVFDYHGIGEVLKSAGMTDAVTEVATTVARNVDAQGLTAESGAAESGAAITAVVKSSVSDRARATVTIEHPAGEGMQAKHGVLTKAAAAAGLEVSR